MLFVPAQLPHPSAVPARALVGFDFCRSSLLPSSADRTLPRATPCNAATSWLLPTVPGNLKALITRPDLLSLETFLARDEDDKDPLSFRVLCLVECRMNLLLLFFTSLHGLWHVLTYNQWSANSTLRCFISKLRVWAIKRYFIHGHFYWHLHFQSELLVLDVCTMEFSAVDLPPEQLGNSSFLIVETLEGTLGMLTRGFDEDSDDDRYWLTYSIMRNNQWHFEKIIWLPVKRAILVGVTGVYLIIEAVYTTSSHDERKSGYFSVDLKILQVELFAAPSKPIYPC
ncbi:uncharacterized protein LOC125518061 [Triticum urartu]|uniref:uncharacterized protein LOC125518061 n=1 Tax=Triticum urartu TaxID=4572 RepID=UPI0020439FE3|nr:uncharacterized protein LOC125518061 [Triticum urartu]